MNRLTCFVYIADESGNVHAFGPNSVVPDWARKKITNPNVWESEPESVEVEVSNGGTGGKPDADGPPPQGGPGASRQKWADYATPLLAAKGVEVQADWKREDIIAACEKAGVPV